MSSKTAKKEEKKDVNVAENTEENTTDGNAEPTAETPSLEALQAELEAARAEAAKNLDGWQRATAELQNFKRRQTEQAARRQEELIADIIAKLFPVLDDLDLAFQNVPDSLTEQEANWIEGFKLVQRKLHKILEEYNVEAITTEGEFNPNLHEAVTHEESAEHDSNAIIAELRKGYKRGDRVLRPSLVRVAQ